jgi:hypothetical protein
VQLIREKGAVLAHEANLAEQRGELVRLRVSPHARRLPSTQRDDTRSLTCRLWYLLVIRSLVSRSLHLQAALQSQEARSGDLEAALAGARDAAASQAAAHAGALNRLADAQQAHVAEAAALRVSLEAEVAAHAASRIAASQTAADVEAVRARLDACEQQRAAAVGDLASWRVLAGVEAGRLSRCQARFGALERFARRMASLAEVHMGDLDALDAEFRAKAAAPSPLLLAGDVSQVLGAMRRQLVAGLTEADEALQAVGRLQVEEEAAAADDAAALAGAAVAPAGVAGAESFPVATPRRRAPRSPAAPGASAGLEGGVEGVSRAPEDTAASTGGQSPASPRDDTGLQLQLQLEGGEATDAFPTPQSAAVRQTSAALYTSLASPGGTLGRSAASPAAVSAAAAVSQLVVGGGALAGTAGAGTSMLLQQSLLDNFEPLGDDPASLREQVLRLRALVLDTQRALAAARQDMGTYERELTRTRFHAASSALYAGLPAPAVSVAAGPLSPSGYLGMRSPRDVLPEARTGYGAALATEQAHASRPASRSLSVSLAPPVATLGMAADTYLANSSLTPGAMHAPPSPFGARAGSHSRGLSSGSVFARQPAGARAVVATSQHFSFSQSDGQLSQQHTTGGSGVQALARSLAASRHSSPRNAAPSPR